MVQWPVMGPDESNLVQQIAPGIYWRMAEPEKRIIANSGWVVFRDWVLVIDANFPWGARPLLEAIRKTTDKPVRHVFDTHYHSDHAFGNSVFVDAGATVIASEATTAESREKNPAAWAKGGGNDGRLEHPQIAFRSKLVLDDGNRRVELISVGPSHTRGDSVAYLPKEKILFPGDLCLTRAGNFVGDPDVNFEGWVRALDALSLMDVGILIPGHGPQGTAAALRGQRNYFADMMTQVRTAISNGVSLNQLQSQIDLSAHNPWGQDAARNRTAIEAIYGQLSRR